MGFTIESVGVRGAYFRKISSNVSTTLAGMTGTATLPTIAFDPTRYFQGTDPFHDFEVGPLDRPSVYLGGNGSGQELDCGLSWDRVWFNLGGAAFTGTFTDQPDGSDGRQPEHTFVVVSQGGTRQLQSVSGAIILAQGDADIATALATLKPDLAFRPFWRTANLGWRNVSPPGSAGDRYFYPGEQVYFSLEVTGDDLLRLTISLVADPTVTFTTDMQVNGFGPGKPQSFKRINSIDQFYVDGSGRHGNENRPVIPTQTQVTGAAWTGVSLLETDGSTVPMAGSAFLDDRSTELAGDYDRIFAVQDAADGSESIDIVPQTA